MDKGATEPASCWESGLCPLLPKGVESGRKVRGTIRCCTLWRRRRADRYLPGSPVQCSHAGFQRLADWAVVTNAALPWCLSVSTGIKGRDAQCGGRGEPMTLSPYLVPRSHWNNGVPSQFPLMCPSQAGQARPVLASWTFPSLVRWATQRTLAAPTPHNTQDHTAHPHRPPIRR